MVDTTPTPRPEKSVRQLLQEVANAGMVNASLEAFKVIDRHASRTKRTLARLGISATDDLVDVTTDAIKRKAIELATGRKQ